MSSLTLTRRVTEPTRRRGAHTWPCHLHGRWHQSISAVSDVVPSDHYFIFFNVLLTADGAISSQRLLLQKKITAAFFPLTLISPQHPPHCIYLSSSRCDELAESSNSPPSDGINNAAARRSKETSSERKAPWRNAEIIQQLENRRWRKSKSREFTREPSQPHPQQQQQLKRRPGEDGNISAAAILTWKHTLIKALYRNGGGTLLMQLLCNAQLW